MTNKVVCIITITGENNYGNRLQNYALEYVLRNLESDVKTLSNSYWKKYLMYNYKEKIWLVYSLIFEKVARLSIKRRLKFRRFDSQFITRDIVKRKLSRHNYDYYVCGSDQIWNFNFFLNKRDLFFAKFVEPKKRIAYSASIGMDYVPDKYISYFKKAIMEFKDISVREDKAAEIIKELTGRDVIVTVDPTLLLNQEEWLKIAKRPKWIKNDKYLLTYFLGNMSDEINFFIKNICIQHNLEIINLYSEYANGEDVDVNSFCSGPDEFIWLIANSQLFITDSYHGCVFATIFNKSFRWFSRNEKGVANMNSRMDTLFSKLQIGDWCIGDVNEDINHLFYKDYSKVEKNLEREKKVAMSYLQRSLNNEQK